MAKFKLTQAANRERAAVVFDRLRKAYPGAACTLDHQNPLELLVATILAAQCTDERVNIVTKTLFKKYRKPEDYVGAPIHELEGDIRQCGFFRQKANSIAKTCRAILEGFGGKVPRTMEQLVELNGVGRKTANVLLGECFDAPAIIVDTHCRRLSNRLGFTKNSDPGKIEQDLMKIWPQERWTLFSHCLVFHGRTVCLSRAPKCSECVIGDLCPFPQTNAGKKIAK
ncbi:MAG TPA: endonuclease III [Candidatus Hydrogenedentes bacterium]|nr:endonuclease III [Candidatus Hydrogenedentota bacterium]HIJ74069.1 endonuclease III [Candidatus Hydrogenedentota bacterium]